MRHEHLPTSRTFAAAALAALLLAAAATAQVAVFDGNLESTSGGLRFADGTLQTTAAGGSATYAGILVVDARGGGDFTTIQAAIDAPGATLPAATSANRYLVRVGPGTFAEQVTMKAWVDLEGAGEGVTVITRTGAATSSAAHTLEAAGNAELRFLTVENTGGAAQARGVIIPGHDSSCRLFRVSVDVSGGTSSVVGVHVSGDSTAVLRAVKAQVVGSSGGAATAFLVENSSPTLLEAEASASGALNNRAIRISEAAEPTILGGIARAVGATGGHEAVSILDASASLVGLRMHASGGSNATALSLNGSPARSSRVQGSRLEADGASFVYGVFNASSEPVQIHASSIVVSPSDTALSADTGTEIDVASSLVQGLIDSLGTYVCAATFDGAFTARGADCL